MTSKLKGMQPRPERQGPGKSVRRASEREAFVYMTLPDTTEPVICGRIQISDDPSGRSRHVGRFVYGRSYLARPNAVPVDPIQLTPLSDSRFETAQGNGLFGALRDAGPDLWGRRIIEKHSGLTAVHELDYLLNSPDDRAGALGFGLNPEPPAPKRIFNSTLDLARLQEIADAIVREDTKDIPEGERVQVEALRLIGSGMGGARPKATVKDEDELWLAKFNREDDRWNSARIEHAMLELGRVVGLTTAESKVRDVAGTDVLLVKRFDRRSVLKDSGAPGFERARMVSGLSLLGIDDSLQARQRWSYPVMVEELRRISATAAAGAQELFRRMCFNALISNTDDHPRNHAVIAWDENWRLSPAYDLTPTAPVAVERRDLALTVGKWGQVASRQNLISEAPRFLLTTAQAEFIVDEMAEMVRAAWRDVARRCGVTAADCEKISGAFVYEGFSIERD